MPVDIAMRYGNPSPKAAFDELLKNNPDLEEVLAIPLYPHYAMSASKQQLNMPKKFTGKINIHLS